MEARDRQRATTPALNDLPLEEVGALCVGDIMSRPAVVVREDASLLEVAQTMLAHNLGGLPVVDSEGRLRGIVTEADFLGSERGVPFSAFLVPQVFGQWIPKEGIERIHKAARSRKVREIMHAPVVSATEEESVTSLVERMVRQRLTRLPVVREDKVVGIVTRHDLLRLMIRPKAS